ncbi:ferredoxin [Paenibacillus darwinianus]|uniref:Ferredoxin n=1 Tax=Paenibacillus darwinianus TaxID=1380763 RepID=A0A9W5W8A5_9BACL|nr:2Fe-2S iron-sulfur cluster-binding protein [Paenibacillus darwinianus]EXX92187.1 ferredoxin [Paenibacillus darwinianus]
MLLLKGRAKSAQVEAESGFTILDLAIKAGVDWGYSCTRGTCARCRTFVEEGAGFLEDVTDAEWDRLEPEELEQGYRAACQAIVKAGAGTIRVVNRFYF